MADRQAVVVGGGIGGLAAAVALHRQGWRVTVLERVASARMGRFGQQLRHPAAVAARNALLRVAPAGASLRGMARYADWQPPG